MSNFQAVIRPRRVTLQVEEQNRAIVQVGKPGPAGAPGSSGASYERTFTQADLSIAGLLPVTHGLDSFPSGVHIWDESGESIGPDRVEVLTADAIALDLSSFTPLQGTWTVSITA